MTKLFFRTLGAALLMLVAISPQMWADDYTPLNYIECNGSINRTNAFTTQYVGKSNTEIDIKFYSYSSGWWTCIFSGRGTGTSDGRTGFSLYQNGSNSSYFGYFAGGNSKDDFMTGNTLNEEHTVVATLGGISLDGAEQVSSGWTNFTASTNGISLFANPNNDNPYNGRIYYMTIKEDGETVRDFQPVMRHDGAYGYYDSYTKEFVQPAQGSYTGYTPGYVDGTFYFTGLSATSIDLSVGQTATVTPTYVGTAPTFQYQSSNESVATVDASGNITPLSEGTTTITVSADPNDGNGAWALTCTVNVVDPTKQAYTDLDYIEANGITYGNSFQTSYVPNANTEVETKFQYYSTGGGYYCVFSGRTYHTRGMSMFVHNNGIGYYMGGYTNDEQFTDFSANTDYTVTANLSSISVTGGNTESAQTNRTTYTSDSQPIEIFANSGQYGSYYNNVLNGRIYYFKISENGTEKYDFVPVMRHDGVYGFYDKASNTFLTTRTGSYAGYNPGYKSGEFYLLATTIKVGTGGTKALIDKQDGATYTFTSNDPSVATVDADGNVTGVAAGSTTVLVTATYNGETWKTTCTVNVVEALTPTISSFPLLTYKQGGKYKCEYLEAEREDRNARRPNADNADWGEINYPAASDTWTEGYGPFVNEDYVSSAFNGEGTTFNNYNTKPVCVFARRMFNLTADELTKIKNSTIMVAICYNQYADLLLNGNKIISATEDGNPWYTNAGTYVYLTLTDEQKNSLVEGNNVLAAMICEGGDPQYLDFGLFQADTYTEQDSIITGTNYITNNGLTHYLSSLDGYYAVNLSNAIELASDVTADNISDINEGRAKNAITYVPASSGITGKNIVSNGVCDNLVLEDKMTFLPNQGFTATSATYTRNMGSEWGTIVLPFATTAPEGVTLYQISGITGGNLVVTSIDDGALKANTPYLFKTSLSEVTFTASNQTITTDGAGTAGTADGAVQLIGSYKYDNQISDANTYFIRRDQFWTPTNYFYCDAFRAYIKTDGTATSPSFSIVVDDDPTGIASADASVSDDEIEAIYSVSGVKTDDLKKGINIVRYRSGKTQKVILK